jgi:hypothetical protein
MGVERAVTRWYALRQCLVEEIAALEAQLAQTQVQAQQHADVPLVAGTEISRQLAVARTKLHDLGPCPKVMMG